MYFGTPMGGIPSAPIPVTLPNVAEAEPGEHLDIWFFDGSPMGAPANGRWRAGRSVARWQDCDDTARPRHTALLRCVPDSYPYHVLRGRLHRSRPRRARALQVAIRLICLRARSCRHLVD